MQYSIISLFITLPLIGACAASLPPPTQRLADAQSSERAAQELGANNVPAAQLSLKNAQDQIAQAQTAMTDGDNERADRLGLVLDSDPRKTDARGQAANILDTGDGAEAPDGGAPVDSPPEPPKPKPPKPKRKEPKK